LVGWRAVATVGTLARNGVRLDRASGSPLRPTNCCGVPAEV